MKKIPLYKLELDLYTEKLDNGLEVFIIPNKKVNNVYAQYTTKYGSVHNKFVPIGENEVIEVPKGVAHFLEHKVFEQEDGTNASDFFANIGATDNANTSCYRTTYLFSCNKEYTNECLEFLQSYVESPYFTDKNVEKEKGIIIQEIGMYNDHPGSVLYEQLNFNTIAEHPFRYSVIGTEKSVSSIDKDILYKCYNTFYHPSNMFITVTGNVEPEEVLELIKKHQDKRKMEEAREIEIPTYDEPDDVYKKHESRKMSVSIPRFGIAYKFNVKELVKKYNLPIHIISKYITTYLCLKTNSTSLLYEDLENKGLLNYTMGGESAYLDNHVIVYLFGVAKDPEKIIDIINKDLYNFNITEDDFNRHMKAAKADILVNSDSIYEMNEKVLSDIINYNKVETENLKRIDELKFDIFKNIIADIKFDKYSTYIIYPEND